MDSHSCFFKKSFAPQDLLDYFGWLGRIPALKFVFRVLYYFSYDSSPYGSRAAFPIRVFAGGICPLHFQGVFTPCAEFFYYVLLLVEVQLATLLA